ncbi:MAG: hypothetical protein DRG82_17455, partial [Deltaproteobacteria bacterium]
MISLAGANTADSTAGLARAVALKQRAMDAEDQFIERMIKQAPGFKRMECSDPPFLADYRRAAREFEELKKRFVWVEPYASSAALVAEYWNDGPGLYRGSLAFMRAHPLSRFAKRLLLLAGCRLLLEKNYPLAQASFETLWRDAPLSKQAVLAYRLVDALNGTGGMKLSPEQMLDWGRALGLGGNHVLRKLISRCPESKEAELAYIQMFKNIERGFAQWTLSRSFRQAELLEKYFTRFCRAFPESPYLQEALILRARFNYRCGKKSQAIARKNDYSWRKYKSSRRKRVARRYSAYASRHFKRVNLVDSVAAVRYPGSPCYFEAGILSSLILFEKDRFAQALEKLRTLLESGPGPAERVRISWYAGLIHYLEGDYQGTIDVLAPLERVDWRDERFWSRAMLFLGKSYLAIGDSSSAGRVFATLARAYPYTYPGIRARRLKKDLITKVSPDWIEELPVIQLPVFPESYTP